MLVENQVDLARASYDLHDALTCPYGEEAIREFMETKDSKGW